MSGQSEPRVIPAGRRAPSARASASQRSERPRPASLPALSLARALYGAALLLVPRRALGGGAGDGGGGLRAFALVLGARNLLEAVIISRHPRRGWALGGAAVDAAHAVSMVGLAAVDRRRRRVALTSALVAGAFAALGARFAPPVSGPTRRC